MQHPNSVTKSEEKNAARYKKCRVENDLSDRLYGSLSKERSTMAADVTGDRDFLIRLLGYALRFSKILSVTWKPPVPSDPGSTNWSSDATASPQGFENWFSKLMPVIAYSLFDGSYVEWLMAGNL
jgi:hypothetical protein